MLLLGITVNITLLSTEINIKLENSTRDIFTDQRPDLGSQEIRDINALV